MEYRYFKHVVESGDTMSVKIESFSSNPFY